MLPNKRRNIDILLGLFVFVGIILLTASIFLLGSERRLFDSSVTFNAYFHDVVGLSLGADVHVGGLLVGRVAQIEFPPMETRVTEPRKIKVAMLVSADMVPWVRKDSIARIEGKGLLGDRIINITVGDLKKPGLKNGDDIDSAVPVDLNDALLKAQNAIDEFSSTAREARKVLSGFLDRGGEKALADAAVSIKNVARELEKGDGLIHQFIYDKKSGKDYQATMADLPKISADLREVIARLKNGEGTVGKLLVDPVPYEKLLGILGGIEENKILKFLIRKAISTKEK